MGMVEFFKNNFDYFWNKYCLSSNIGYKLLGPEESGSNNTFVILWAKNLNSDIRVIIILYLLSNKVVLIILTNISEERMKNSGIIKKMPAELNNSRKKIGNFCFVNQEILNLSNGQSAINSVMNKKIMSINDSSFEKIFSSLVNKGGRKNKPKAHSVYTISGGLYGLGKNRKH